MAEGVTGTVDGSDGTMLLDTTSFWEGGCNMLELGDKEYSPSISWFAISMSILLLSMAILSAYSTLEGGKEFMGKYEGLQRALV